MFNGQGIVVCIEQTRLGHLVLGHVAHDSERTSCSFVDDVWMSVGARVCVDVMLWHGMDLKVITGTCD